MKKPIIIFLFLFLGSCLCKTANAQNPPRVLFQAFWWDYWNNNYPLGWYNYLTELAPRLKSYGIDAVWVPPCSKGGDHNDDGYGIFDHYDLGDKYQKGDVHTRLGTKDELLRMVAVMHANGIDVIQDIVLNQVANAGPVNAVSDPLGKGAIDPNAPNGPPSNPDKWKNFRYTSYSHPATDESANDYLNRNGRWPKNYQNFHESNDNTWGHNDYNWPYHAELYGPDVCYKQNAINANGIPLSASTYGLSSIYNPIQPSDYMKQQAIQWGVWLKKQVGFDGVRVDAAKHVDFDDANPAWDVVSAFLWNLQHGTSLYGSSKLPSDLNDAWADGSDNMFAVSEFIPESGLSMPSFIDGIQNRSGTFDFPLRDAVYNMVNQTAMTPFDISSIPGAQIDQSHRGRTVSFVNNHDDFRPQLDMTTGNYVSMNPGSNDPRAAIMPAAYALISALDGSPTIFFEDMFDIGSNGNRFTHVPTSTTNLPARIKIANVIWARRALNFAGGAYKVRSAEAGAFWVMGGNQDLIAIERSGKAVIGVNDNPSSSQSVWIDTDFTNGTPIKDYSGNSNYAYTVTPSQRIQVTVPPAGIDAMGNAVGGYVIIAPVGSENITFNPTIRSTTQEWEMSDDLGDSHSLSLGQGGAVPAFGIWFNPRTVGRIFSDAGKSIHLELYPTNTGSLRFPYSLTLGLYASDGTLLTSNTGSGKVTLDFVPTSVNYYTIKVANATSGSPGQNVFVKATYTAPQVVNTALYNTGGGASSSMAIQSSAVEPAPQTSITASPNPSRSTATIRFSVAKDTNAELTIYSANASEDRGTPIMTGFFKEGTYESELDCAPFKQGIYILRLKTDDETKHYRLAIGR